MSAMFFKASDLVWDSRNNKGGTWAHSPIRLFRCDDPSSGAGQLDTSPRSYRTCSNDVESMPRIRSLSDAAPDAFFLRRDAVRGFGQTCSIPVWSFVSDDRPAGGMGDNVRIFHYCSRYKILPSMLHRSKRLAASHLLGFVCPFGTPQLDAGLTSRVLHRLTPVRFIPPFCFLFEFSKEK